ncbi:MAG: O-antigen ligase family protein [Bacteriovoracaceae bacterium]
MNTDTNFFYSKLFHPMGFIILYLFMSITTLQAQVPFFATIHLELLTLGGALFLTLIHIFVVDKERITFNHPLSEALLIPLLYGIVPILTSLFSQDELKIFKDDEYKTLLEMILFGSALFYFMCQNSFQRFFLNIFTLFYVVFAGYFLYRYLILNEVREFDLRPLLKIRHGDPNFLCTFFSMMIPIPLMLFYTDLKKRYYLRSLMYLLASLLLLVCAYLTESRMGIISVIVGLIYLMTRPVFKIPKKLLIVVALFLGSLIFFIRGERVLNRYTAINDLSNVNRVLTWENGLQVFLDNPLLGAGMHKASTFYYENTGYPHFQSEFRELDVHNTFLKVLADLGLVGLLFFMLFYLWPICKATKMANDNRYFIICSFIILTLSILTIGIPYKDLFVLHIFVLASLTYSTKSEILAT